MEVVGRAARTALGRLDGLQTPVEVRALASTAEAERGSASGEAGVSLGQDPREDALVHGAGSLDV